MFQGRFEHTLDDKGRMAIPSPFRRRLSLAETQGAAPVSESEGTVIVTVSDQCLSVYAPAEWQEKLAKISKYNQLDPKISALKRIVVGSAQECPIDKAGRILIPANLRSHAAIERDCIVLGQIEQFEIWGAERWNKTFNQLSDQVGEIYRSLAESGIQI